MDDVTLTKRDCLVRQWQSSCYLAQLLPFKNSAHCSIIAISQPWTYSSVHVFIAAWCLPSSSSCLANCLIPLGFQLCHPHLSGLKGFPIDSHQLKKQSNMCYQDTRDLRGQWWHWNRWSYLVDFPRCHDQCRRHHDSVAGNPHQHAALLALLPKDCTNAWKSITRQYTDFSSRQIQVTLWFQDGDFSRYLGSWNRISKA